MNSSQSAQTTNHVQLLQLLISQDVESEHLDKVDHG